MKLPLHLEPCAHLRSDGKQFGCAVLGECKPAVGGRQLRECPEYVWTMRHSEASHIEHPCKGAIPLLRQTVIPGEALANCADGNRFNASVIDYHGRRLLAYRAGRTGSQIYVAELGKDYFPGPSVRLNLDHPMAAFGREDPRLFIHRERLHCSFIGVNGKQGPTSCLYAVLDDNLRVEKITYPAFDSRAAWEKNWCWVSHADKLFCIYTISPHTILEVDGDRANLLDKFEWFPKWEGGFMRGGASPVLVGDEYWSFFHGSLERGRSTGCCTTRRRLYSIGVYIFSATPPFRPIRYTPRPIYWADTSTRPASFWCDCIFPAGAILDGDRWIISCGVHDTWVGIYEFSHSEIERQMIKC